MSKIQVIAHRGIRGLYLENSIESFRAAAESNADLVEFDVQATKDGRLVVCHSMESPKRVYGITSPINDLSWQELQQYKSAEGASMPSIDDVLAVLKNKPVLVDIKDLASAPLLVKFMRQSGVKNIQLLNSLYPEALTEIKASFPDIKTSLQTYKRPFKTIRIAKRLGFSHANLVLYLLNPLSYWWARRAGLGVITYQNYISFVLTWRWFAWLLWLVYPGVAIVTDRPDRIR